MNKSSHFKIVHFKKAVREKMFRGRKNIIISDFISTLPLLFPVHGPSTVVDRMG